MTKYNYYSHEKYIENRKAVIERVKKNYASKHPRKYARYFEIISPDGTVTKCANYQQVEAFFGYTIKTCFKKSENGSLFGYKINKIV